MAIRMIYFHSYLKELDHQFKCISDASVRIHFYTCMLIRKLVTKFIL